MAITLVKTDVAYTVSKRIHFVYEYIYTLLKCMGLYINKNRGIILDVGP